MTKQIVEQFVKGNRGFEVKLKAGVDTNPPGYPNAMFFIEMSSYKIERDEWVITEPIYLTLAEMAKLSVLMTTASQFWTKTFNKYSKEDLKKIDAFCKEWKRIRESVESIFEK